MHVASPPHCIKVTIIALHGPSSGEQSVNHSIALFVVHVAREWHKAVWPVEKTTTGNSQRQQ